MHKRGLREKWTDWIKRYISIRTVFVLINGMQVSTILGIKIRRSSFTSFICDWDGSFNSLINKAVFGDIYLAVG